MEKIKYTQLDGGTLEERIEEAKIFLGLKPEQSFQDIEIAADNDD